MDSKFSQMVQIGDTTGDTVFFFEDYAYTYLKKNSDKDKLFLYGEVEKQPGERKIYIYGISLSSKMEKTYFKEYAPIGSIRIKEGEKYWLCGKEEVKIEGYFIFYSSNQPMQEYLIEQSKSEQVQEDEKRKKRERGDREELNIRERLNLRSEEELRYKSQKGNTGIFLLGSVGLAVMILFGLSTVNGQKKIEVFKEIIEKEWKDTVPYTEELLIEEKEIKEEDYIEETLNEDSAAIIIEEVGQGMEENEEAKVSVNEDTIIEEMKDKEAEKGQKGEKEELSEAQETDKEVSEAEEGVSEGKQSEYIVKEGDTLAGICKKFYGTADRLKEISEHNHITNMDHIAPGQKLYLPN